MNAPIWFTTCPACGKRGYRSRKEAKTELRIRSSQGVSVYRCKEGGELWHQGHLPGFVKDGRLDRGILHSAPRTPKRSRGPLEDRGPRTLDDLG